jgi:hypothetical protein
VRPLTPALSPSGEREAGMKIYLSPHSDAALHSQV